MSRRRFLAQSAAVGAASLGAFALPRAALAQQGRAAMIRRAAAALRRLRRAHVAGISACSRGCNEGQLLIQLPGKLRISYDHNSTVVANENRLVTTSGGDTVISSVELAETQLALLLDGEVNDELVRSTSTRERSPLAGGRGPSTVHVLELARDGLRLDLLLSPAGALHGWVAPGNRGSLYVELRDLRPATSVAEDAFELPEETEASAASASEE